MYPLRASGPRTGCATLSRASRARTRHPAINVLTGFGDGMMATPQAHRAGRAGGPPRWRGDALQGDDLTACRGREVSVPYTQIVFGVPRCFALVLNPPVSPPTFIGGVLALAAHATDRLFNPFTRPCLSFLCLLNIFRKRWSSTADNAAASEPQVRCNRTV